MCGIMRAYDGNYVKDLEATLSLAEEENKKLRSRLETAKIALEIE